MTPTQNAHPASGTVNRRLLKTVLELPAEAARTPGPGAGAPLPAVQPSEGTQMFASRQTQEPPLQPCCLTW